MSAHTIAICNQKGGVGKTTTTFHLATAAVRAGHKVLLVDADPQGNLTMIAAADQLPADHVGLADVLSARAGESIEDVTVPAVWAGVDLVPTVGATLELVRDELVIAGAGREGRLRAALAGAREKYDLILIDCPPSLDQLTINALTAADGVLVVTEAKLLSVEGISKLQTTVETVRSHYAPELRILGVVINKHEPQTISGREWVEQIASAVPVLEPLIPKRQAVADASEAATGLDAWPSRSSAALTETYDQLLTNIEGALT